MLRHLNCFEWRLACKFQLLLFSNRFLLLPFHLYCIVTTVKYYGPQGMERVTQHHLPRPPFLVDVPRPPLPIWESLATQAGQTWGPPGILQESLQVVGDGPPPILALSL